MLPSLYYETALMIEGRRRGLTAALTLDLLRGVGEYLRLWRDYRRLQELSDYLLDDVGLTRAEINAASRRLF
jgi:uncharacterized protein YjiS (DUF1127 family)